MIGAALSLLALQASGQDAAMFRSGPEHTGVYEGAGVAKTPQVKWKFKTQGRVYSSPAFANGVVYFGSTDHILYAVNANDGSVKWKSATESLITSSPAVADGRVYFGSYDGKFYALDAVMGKLAWKFETEGERRYAGKHLHGLQPAGETMPDMFDVFLSSPVVWNGKVYFGSGDGNIYALDAATGKLAWKYKTGDVVHASPAIANGILFVGSWDSYFYALDASSGKLAWRFKTGEDEKIHNQVGIQSSAVVADGIVYFGCRDSNLYAIDAHTGKEKWRFNNKGSWVVGSPAVRDGKMYFATSDSALFYALDAKTGAQAFSLQFKWPMFSSPSIASSLLYIGSNEGKLTAIDLAGQKTAWIFQTDGSRENGGTYTTPDGKPKYEAAFADTVIGARRMMSVGSILSSPVIVGDVVYFGSSDGNLYALN
jgi:outer membrane protein assembly factor BamB